MSTIPCSDLQIIQSARSHSKPSIINFQFLSVESAKFPVTQKKSKTPQIFRLCVMNTTMRLPAMLFFRHRTQTLIRFASSYPPHSILKMPALSPTMTQGTHLILRARKPWGLAQKSRRRNQPWRCAGRN